MLRLITSLTFVFAASTFLHKVVTSLVLAERSIPIVLGTEVITALLLLSSALILLRSQATDSLRGGAKAKALVLTTCALVGWSCIANLAIALFVYRNLSLVPSSIADFRLWIAIQAVESGVVAVLGLLAVFLPRRAKVSEEPVEVATAA